MNVEEAKAVLLKWAAEGEPAKETDCEADIRAGERPNVAQVRLLCWSLLRECNADGMGGCKLCGG